MRIGVIGAMQIEIDNLKKSLENSTTEEISSVQFVKGNIGEVEVVAAVSGVGKVFAAICTEAMILKYQVDMVVNIGVAGTLCKELGVMDVALASQVVQHDMNTSALGDDIGLLSGINQIYIPSDEKMTALMEQCIAEKEIHYKVGTIATGDLFMQGERQKEKLHQRFDAIAAEMEGGSIGHVCRWYVCRDCAYSQRGGTVAFRYHFYDDALWGKCDGCRNLCPDCAWYSNLSGCSVGYLWLCCPVVH